MTDVSVPAATPPVVSPRSWTLGKLRNPLTIACIAFIALLVAAAVLAPWIAPHDPYDQDIRRALSGPSADNWLGTDEVGRDILSRLMHGGRISLVAAVQAVSVAVLIGVPAGVVAGYFGGFVDKVFDRLSDVVLSTPSIVVVLTVLAVFGPNLTAAMVTLGVLITPDFVRLVRGSTLAVRAELYVDAARVAGLSHRRIILRHILPNVLGPVIIRASMVFGVALLVESGLSYIGLGPPPPAPTWGSMVAAAGQTIYTQPWYLVPTGLMITATVLAFNLLGDSIHDATSPFARIATTRTAPPPRAGAPAVIRTVERGVRAGRTDELALLSVRDLEVSFPAVDRWQPVVQDVSFDVGEKESLGFVGESGSGKTITMLAVLGLIPQPGRITRGSIVFDRQELLGTSGDAGFRAIRGAKIGFVAQEPMVNLDPVFTVGKLIGEPMRRHRSLTRRQTKEQVLELLDLVGMPDPRGTANSFPHQLSGGMAQRVAIALALGSRPKLLVADEPTTALDVTIQAEILDLFRRLQDELSMAVIIVTHNLGVLADFCSSAAVMYAGQVVEHGSVAAVLGHPLMPYTEGLLRSNPHSAVVAERLQAIPGTVPLPSEWPSSCHFQSRCPMVIEACRAAPVALADAAPGRQSRCIRFAELLERSTA